ncbi:MAG: type II toxin-antitoxin system RelE/ParE family toxin [bacterium]|nr:type II toxin-antitoxin system RelE/ParE family toxin [bacterium]
MKVITLSPVRSFVERTDDRTFGRIRRALNLLEMYGHTLSMPFSKPIGGGLFELRVEGSATVRMLYGFCDGLAVIVFAGKKERPALRRKDIILAHKRLSLYCG